MNLEEYLNVEKVEHLTFLHGTPIYKHKEIENLYFGKFDFHTGKPEKMKNIINVYYFPDGFWYQIKVVEEFVEDSPDIAMEYIQNRVEKGIEKIKANIENYKVR